MGGFGDNKKRSGFSIVPLMALDASDFITHTRIHRPIHSFIHYFSSPISFSCFLLFKSFLNFFFLLPVHSLTDSFIRAFTAFTLLPIATLAGRKFLLVSKLFCTCPFSRPRCYTYLAHKSLHSYKPSGLAADYNLSLCLSVSLSLCLSLSLSLSLSLNKH